MRVHRAMPATAALALGALLAGSLSGGAIAADRSHSMRFLVHADGSVRSTASLQRAVPSSVRVTGAHALARDLAIVTVRSASDPAAVEHTLQRLPGVADVSVDRRITVAGAKAPVRTSDQLFPYQWDLWDGKSTARAGGYGVDAPRAWTKTLGSPSVVVAVVDTGITQHPDLAGATILPGYDFVSGADGVDTGDGDGWDADPTDPGDACSATGEPSSWHGTFVAGEIVAGHGDGGLAGMAPRVAVQPVRVLGGCGGSEADMVAAIEWASGGTVAGVPVDPTPAAVISMSLGAAGGPCPSALQAAIDDATARGSLVVAAAGNDGRPVSDTSPANCRGVVSVVATTRSGGLASYSNRGTAAMRPTLAAPGGSRSAPVLGDGWSSEGALTASGNRPTVVGAAGTSMAAPRVAAAAALLLSRDRGLAPAAVTARLTAAATAFPRGSTCTAVRCGAGVVNAGDLLGAKGRFVGATLPRVLGSAEPGERLTASVGTWHPAPDHVRYRWLRDGKPITGATGKHYRVRQGDAGHRITVRVTAVRPRTVTATAVSPARSIHR